MSQDHRRHQKIIHRVIERLDLRIKALTRARNNLQRLYEEEADLVKKAEENS